MRRSLSILAGTQAWLSAAQTPTKDGLMLCPIKGQQFPAPSGLSQEPIWQDAATSLTKTLEANLTQGPYNETTFSIGVFSTTDENLLFEYHHSDPSVMNSTMGASKVDADSIYRIASISKILTIYLWLIRDGDRRLSDPIVEHIPELAMFNTQDLDYALPDWSEITIGDLMSYLAGAGRDYGLNDISIQNSVTADFTERVAASFIDDALAEERPTCGYFVSERYLPCNQDDYLKGLSRLGANFPAAYTPLYSNANFAILGIALSNLLKSPMEVVFNTSLVGSLNLTGTSHDVPHTVTERSVIPDGDLSTSGWNNELGPLAPAAGAFSTTKDLAAIGRAILNSTLMSKSTTRRWYSSTAFVETIGQAVGRGWEIFRLQSGGQSVELYTKSGSWKVYTSVFAIIPDYNIGFSILTTSIHARAKLSGSFPNTLTPILLEAVEKIALQQARRNFVGHYSSPTSNTSVTIETDDSPGLKLTQYTSNGIDLLATVFALFGENVDFRLVPNQLYDKKGQVGFTGVYASLQHPVKNGTFYYLCQTWFDIDDFTYGSVPLGSFVFEVDDKGRAETVRLKAFKETLERKRI